MRKIQKVDIEQDGICARCGLDHSRLGLRLQGGTLTRHARGSVHRVRVLGGGWALDRAFYDAHRFEIEWAEVFDDESGASYNVNGDELRKNTRYVTLGGNAQAFLALKHWTVTNPATSDELRELLDFTPGEKQQALFFMGGSTQ